MFAGVPSVFSFGIPRIFSFHAPLANCKRGTDCWKASWRRFPSWPFWLLVIAGLTLLGQGRALAQRPLGIDVSSYQDTVNWTNVKSAGITFAYAKAAEGTSTDGYVGEDPDFVSNITHAKSAGVLIGAYYFCHPETDTGLSGADAEAQYFWGIISNYVTTNGSYLMPALDFESDVADAGYTQTTLSEWVNEWCNDITNYAYAKGVVVTPVVYTYVDYANGTSGNGPGVNSTVTQWPLWMASPNGDSPQTGAPSATAPWSTWTLWQYGQADISGITTGVVDEDVFDGTATQLTNTLVIGKAVPPPPSNVTNFWDPSNKDASPGSGGSGTWDNSTSNWWLSGTGDIVWSAAGDYAIFAGTSGTVTLGASVAADSITFSNGGYVITGSDTLTLNSPGKIVLPAGTTNSIECVLGGAAYTLSGGGTLYLNNAGNYSDGETIIGPNTTLQVPSEHPVGNDGVTMNLQNGGIYQVLDSTSGDQFLLPGSAVALLTGGGIFENPNGNLSMTNYITGSGSLTLIGTTYTLTLTYTGNNYSGGTIVQSGTLNASATGTLGSTSAPISVYGGTLNLGGASHTVGAVTITNGTISNGTLTGASYAGQSGSISATLAGSAAFTKSTSGEVTLSGTNTYTGITTVTGGLLQINADAKLGTAPGSPVTNQIFLNNAGISSGIRCTGSFTFSANRGITVTGSGGSVQATSGQTVTYPNVITGNGNLGIGSAVNLGYGTNIFTAANTYKGTTTIAAGTLQLGANGTLPSGTPLIIAADSNTLGGGVFDMNGHSQTIGPLASSPGIGGTGTDTPTLKLSGALTVLQTNTGTVFAGVISGSGGSLTLNGNNTLTLTGTNTYTGPTILSAGTLALATNGSINSSASISIAAGATFDVSGLSSATYSIGSGSTLAASGTGTSVGSSAAVIKAASGGTAILLSRPIVLTFTPTSFSGDTTHPSLYVSQGTLSLNGNPFTVTNASGTALGPGTYVLIQQASGSVLSSGSYSVNVVGSGIAGGNTSAISVSNGTVNLVVASSVIPVAFTNLAASQSITYGASGITLSGTVSGSGPVYPAMGEAVTATINGNMQSTTVSDSTGDFSFTYNPSTVPASGVPYTITYSYAGDASLGAATNTSTTLTVNQLPVILTGTRPYDGTTTAAAGILSVANKVGSDVVTVASGSGTLASANVGPEAITSFGTLALGGGAAGNYTLTGASGAVTITTPPFSILACSLDPVTSFTLTWQSVAGLTYQVIGSTNPTAALNTWTNVGSPITATGTNTSATNPISSSLNFYNVVSP